MAAESMKDIKNRIKSIQSTRQITKAMELVASSKLKKARERVEQTRPFFNICRDTIHDILSGGVERDNIYCHTNEIKKPCYCVIGGDRGLAGGYNSNIFKAVLSHAGDSSYKTLPIGKKTFEFFEKRSEFVADNYRYVSEITFGNCFYIGELLKDLYKQREIDGLYIAYTDFTSVMAQEARVMQVLPLKIPSSKKNAIIYEPSPAEVFNGIITDYIGGLLCNAVAESYASELCSRRNAMETATGNADEMIDGLSLKYNRARQAAITQEITEIVSGSSI